MQLSRTPDAFITVDEQSVVTPQFVVDYPAGWRVVKANEAGAPVQLVFAAPDDTMTITVSAREIIDDDPLREMTIEINDVTLWIAGSAAPEYASQLDATFDFVLASVR